MSDTLVQIRKRSLPELLVSDTGKERIVGGRWSLQRVADRLIRCPWWHTMDDLARFVYGTTGKLQRVNARKHIPSQRNFMLNSLEQPIVTMYGERGRIRQVKLYQRENPDEEILLRAELERLRDRKEVSINRFEALERQFLLPLSGGR